MKARLKRPASIAAAAVLLLGCAAGALMAWRHSPQRELPYRDAFAAGRADEWKALGGTWELVNGAIRNDSDERGAKLVTGSPYWRNYLVEADVYLLGINGDAGLIIRVSHEEDGVNAYSGYYAGVRTIDQSVVLGRADHAWLEVARRYPVPNGIRPFQWYHLKLMAVGCQIVASAGTPSQADQVSLGVNDAGCISAGRIGLRSYSSGGIWRNVIVRPATAADLADLLSKGSGTLMASAAAMGPVPQEVRQLLEREQEQEATAERSMARVNTQTISSLRLSSFASPETATVRGVVVLTSPRLYVEDASGGLYISQYSGPLLKVGDEVQVTGNVHPGDFSAQMDHARIELLWARTPAPPVSVTAAQAATGRYDATFIEVRGELKGKEREPDNRLILDLDDGPQSFRAMLNPGRSDALFSQLRINSQLRLRGVCVVDSALTHNLTPFVLLLPSNEDLDVIAGPPWWSTGHVIALIAAAGLLTIFAVILYHRIENWRLRAILEERSWLANEMHDTLAQSFAGIGFQLQAIRNGVPPDIPRLHEQLDLARDLVRHSHEEARRSIASLRTEALESDDLVGALEQCARRMVDGTGVQIVAETTGEKRPVTLRMSDTLFRIGQEAIANAVRHADPSRLTIRLTWRADAVCLEIEDNGRGFVPAGRVSGLGILGMRRRAQSVMAVLRVESEPGAGTRVRIEAPLPPKATLATWLRALWKHTKDSWNHARPARPANSHLYRG